MNRLKTYLWTLVAAIGVVSVYYLFSHGAGGIASFRQEIDLYADDTDYKELTPFDLIYADYYISLGCFGEEETTTTNRSGKVVSKSSTYYYAIPVFSGEDTYWIGLEVAGEKDANTMETITDETYAYLADEADDYGFTMLSKYGSLKKMDKEMYGYMVEAFEGLEIYDSEEIAEYVLPVYISTFYPENMQKMFLAAVGALLVCVILLVLWVRAIIRRRKENKKYQESWENPQVSGYSGSTTGEALIKIGGNTYPKRFFYRVNTYVQNNDLENAKQELRNVTGITQYQAEDVIAHWKEYYSE